MPRPKESKNKSPKKTNGLNDNIFFLTLNRLKHVGVSAIPHQSESVMLIQFQCVLLDRTYYRDHYTLIKFFIKSFRIPFQKVCLNVIFLDSFLISKEIFSSIVLEFSKVF